MGPVLEVIPRALTDTEEYAAGIAATLQPV
jgi:hypothetical protein